MGGHRIFVENDEELVAPRDRPSQKSTTGMSKNDLYDFTRDRDQVVLTVEDMIAALRSCSGPRWRAEVRTRGRPRTSETASSTALDNPKITVAVRPVWTKQPIEKWPAKKPRISRRRLIWVVALMIIVSLIFFSTMNGWSWSNEHGPMEQDSHGVIILQSQPAVWKRPFMYLFDAPEEEVFSILALSLVVTIPFMILMATLLWMI